MIFSFRYGEAKVLPTQKVMIFYYFTVESLISLLATNKKFLAGKKKIWKDFSTEYFFYTCFEPYFLEDPHQQTTQPSLQGQDYEKQQNLESVWKNIGIKYYSSFRQVRN